MLELVFALSHAGWLYALWFSVFARVLVGECLERHCHLLIQDIVALLQCQRDNPVCSLVHAQLTRSCIISLAVRQTLHMRIRLGWYLGSSMASR